MEGEADAEQQRRVAIAAANAQAIEGETQSQARVAAAQAELQVRQAEAYQTGETRKRVAAAAVAEAENRAQAKAALAQAEKVEAERRAELEAPAKAEKAKQIVAAEAAGQSRRIQAEAEAAAVLARLRAQAQGEFEILAKKGEGLQAIVDACGGADAAYKLLLLEKIEHLADKAAEAVQNIKLDKVVVWDGGGANGGTTSFLQNMGRSLPPMMNVLRDIAGVELPGFMGTMVPEAAANGGSGAPVVAPPDAYPAKVVPAAPVAVAAAKDAKPKDATPERANERAKMPGRTDGPLERDVPAARRASGVRRSVESGRKAIPRHALAQPVRQRLLAHPLRRHRDDHHADRRMLYRAVGAPGLHAHRDRARAHRGHAGAQLQQVVEARRRQEVDLQVAPRQPETELVHHLRHGHPGSAPQLLLGHVEHARERAVAHDADEIHVLPAHALGDVERGVGGRGHGVGGEGRVWHGLRDGG